MSKNQGQAAQLKKGAKITMGGSIHLQLKRATIDQLVQGKEICVEEDVVEFYLKIDVGTDDRIIEFSPYFGADEAQVIIDNGVAIEGRHSIPGHDDIDLYRSLSVVVANRAGKGKRSFEFLVNLKQAAILGKTLGHYIAAIEAVDGLEKLGEAASGR